MSSEEKQALKTGSMEAFGSWDDGRQHLLERDPGYFSAALALEKATADSGVLDAATRALVELAVNVAVTHLDAKGTTRAIERAVALGVPPEQTLEVCHLTSVLGVQSCVVGLPILAEELAALGRSDELGPPELDATRQDLKEAFVRSRGYWSPLWDLILRSSPGYFAAYLEFSSYPWTRGTLAPKLKELIYVAIDASTNHLFEPGIRIHIRNALAHRATAAEIVAVLQVTSLIGIQSSVLGASVLATLPATSGDPA